MRSVLRKRGLRARARSKQASKYRYLRIFTFFLGSAEAPYPSVVSLRGGGRRRAVSVFAFFFPGPPSLLLGGDQRWSSPCGGGGGLFLLFFRRVWLSPLPKSWGHKPFGKCKAPRCPTCDPGGPLKCTKPGTFWALPGKRWGGGFPPRSASFVVGVPRPDTLDAPPGAP